MNEIKVSKTVQFGNATIILHGYCEEELTPRHSLIVRVDVFIKWNGIGMVCNIGRRLVVPVDGNRREPMTVQAVIDLFAEGIIEGVKTSIQFMTGEHAILRPQHKMTPLLRELRLAPSEPTDWKSLLGGYPGSAKSARDFGLSPTNPIQ